MILGHSSTIKIRESISLSRPNIGSINILIHITISYSLFSAPNSVLLSPTTNLTIFIHPTPFNSVPFNFPAIIVLILPIDISPPPSLRLNSPNNPLFFPISIFKKSSFRSLWLHHHYFLLHVMALSLAATVCFFVFDINSTIFSISSLFCHFPFPVFLSCFFLFLHHLNHYFPHYINNPHSYHPIYYTNRLHKHKIPHFPSPSTALPSSPILIYSIVYGYANYIVLNKKDAKYQADKAEAKKNAPAATHHH